MIEPNEDEKCRLAEKAAAIEAKYAAGQAAAPSSQPAEAAPAVRMNDDGAEASMSVSDTNALRASLGLKPLAQNSASKDDVARAEHRRGMERKRAREREQESKALEQKLAEKKEQRRIDAQLRQTRGLGESSQQDDDDVLVRAQPLPMLQHETEAVA